MAKKDARTLPELMHELTISYTPKVKVKQIDAIFDVKGWMEASSSDLTGHIYQHQFKIKRNEGGKAVLFYKKWSSSDEWLPAGDHGIGVITGIPDGEPQMCEPSIEKVNIDKIEQDLPKSGMKLDAASVDWWK